MTKKVWLCAALLGCGGSNESAAAPDAAVTDTAADVETSAPSNVYPAFAPGSPLMRNNGGAVLKSPKIVTVTWAGDPNAALVESFGDKIGATAYWRSITEEYGVGAPTSGPENHVRLAEAMPISLKVGGLQLFLAMQLADPAKSKWPAPTAETIYMLYVPGCPEGGAYHNTADIRGTLVPYGVVGTCELTGVSTVESLTVVASHEISEASTDPHVFIARAWAGFDAPSLAWELWTTLGAESADVCQFLSDPYTRGGEELPYMVQRQWSNKSALAGNDPCLPLPSTPYFNVVAQGLEDVTQDMSTKDTTSPPLKSKGFNIKVGASRDITLGFFSSAPTADWTLSVEVGNTVLETYLDNGIEASIIGSATGNNGSTATLRVKVTSPGTALKDGHLLTVKSQSGTLTNRYPILITH